MAANLALRAAALTDVGKRRAKRRRVLARPEIGLWAVADGMGGHGGGDVASQAVVAALADVPPPRSASDLLDAFRGAHRRRQRGLARARASRRARVIGSTLAALLIYGAHFACVWCGDSRVYRLRGGGSTNFRTTIPKCRTSSIAACSTKRRPNPGRAAISSRGRSARPISAELEIVDGPADRGDRFLICSDGLTAHVEDEEIAAHLARRRPAGDLPGLSR